jgi:hypothetical protein
VGESPVAVVRASLQHYAARGAFRSFSESSERGLARFQFVWFRDVMFRVTFDPRTLTLTFVRLLPAVPARSPMDRRLRAFIESRSDRSVPEHRRFDTRKAAVTVVNRGGQVSVVFRLQRRHVEYGVRKAVHLVHEVLMDFLNEPEYVQYNVDHFNLNPEMA